MILILDTYNLYRYSSHLETTTQHSSPEQTNGARQCFVLPFIELGGSDVYEMGSDVMETSIDHKCGHFLESRKLDMINYVMKDIAIEYLSL